MPKSTNQTQTLAEIHKKGHDRQSAVHPPRPQKSGSICSAKPPMQPSGYHHRRPSGFRFPIWAPAFRFLALRPSASVARRSGAQRWARRTLPVRRSALTFAEGLAGSEVNQGRRYFFPLFSSGATFCKRNSEKTKHRQMLGRRATAENAPSHNMNRSGTDVKGEGEAAAHGKAQPSPIWTNIKIDTMRKAKISRCLPALHY